MAHAYNRLTGEWIGLRPLSWFDGRFADENGDSILTHTGPNGERPDVPHTSLAELTVQQLRAYADEHEIDLQGASKRDDIVERIAEVETAPGDPQAPEDPAQTEVAAVD